MARGRFLSRSVWGSKRFAQLVKDHGADAGLVYIACVTGADVAGRLEADGDSIVDLMKRTGRALGLDPDRADALVQAIGRTGLLRVWGDPPDVFAEVVGFFDHNRTRADRESPSDIPDPPREDSGRTPGVVREPSRGDSPSPREYANTSSSTSSRVSTSTSPSSRRSSRSSSDDDHQPQRLRGDDRPGDPNQLIRVWRRIFQEVNEKMTAAGRPIIPKPVLDVHRADRLAGVVDALQYFPDDDTLAAELRRVLAVFEFFGWKAVRAEAVIEKVGQSFEDAPGDIRDPVVWQKDDPDANPGRMAPAVREIAAGIGKEMPDG